MMRPGRPKMSPIKSMRKITPQEISFEDNTQGRHRWLRARDAYRIKKLLTAKVAKESREGREESLGITLNSHCGVRDGKLFLASFAGASRTSRLRDFPEQSPARLRLRGFGCRSAVAAHAWFNSSPAPPSLRSHNF